jgi:membrane-associated phospholipid phosphatase
MKFFLPKAVIFSWILVAGAISPVAAEYVITLWDVPLTIGAAMVSVYGNMRYSDMEKPADADVKPKSELLPWDRPVAGRYSDLADRMSDWAAPVAVAPVALAGYAWYNGGTASGFLGYTLMYAQALAIQDGLNTIARSTQLWPRPYIYAEEGEGREAAEKAKGEAYGSFFSGHASAAFTTAVFTAKLFDEMYPASPYSGLVWAGSLSLAGFVGALRIAAGKHYPTDVVVGALVGTGVSLLVLETHKESAKNVSLWVGPGNFGAVFSF